jgi:putative tryptophan/tyrosine transport system substrate-binding protein
MRRRDFLAGVGLAPAMWPFPARAQRPPAIPIIGYLDSSGLPPWYAAFERGLNDLGYVQGRTIAIEHRSAAGQAERLPALAAELVSLQPKVIVTSGSPAAVAASKVTATIPIVFTFATDPVGLGLVASLARPGGNITGQSNQGPGLVGKRLQVLAEMVPGASRFSVVWTPSFAANHADFGEMQRAAATLGLVLHSLEVTRPSDFDAAFQEAAARTSGVAVLSGPLIFASPLRHGTRCRRSITMPNMPRPDWSRTARALSACTVAPRSSSTGFSKAKSRQICRSSSQSGSSSS